jgi:hypothetical protein
VEDDEAIEEGVVVSNGGGNGGPVEGRHGRRVKQRVKLNDAIADVPLVGGGRRAQRLNGDGLAIVNCWDGDCCDVSRCASSVHSFTELTRIR